MKVQKASLPLTLALVLAAFAVPLGAQTTTPIFVELNSPAPTAVASFQAAEAGQTFDAALYRASVLLSQDNFLQQLTAAGITYTLTNTTLQLASGGVKLPDRYTDLINAIHMVVAGPDVARIRANPNVRHISVDVPIQLDLNTSVPYIRANCPPPSTDSGCTSARSRGLRGTGTINADGSATGQVIAILDTGIHAGVPPVPGQPMFDDRVGDDQYLQRKISNPDLRPVRLQGSLFVPGVDHTKVVYRALFGASIGDDVGHGTMVASTAAGLKVQIQTDTNPNEQGLTLEGVAPGALLMDYKVCPSLVCTGTQIMLALQDAAQDRDVAGFPKPRATVVNMSFGNNAGDENSADSIAAGNLQFVGVVPEASAGNDGPREQIIGSPAAGRLVVASAATNDPGKGGWSADVLSASSFPQSPTGSKTPASGFSPAPGQRTGIQLFPMQGSPNPPAGSMAQYYVFVKNGQTAGDFPSSVSGRIALVKTSGALLPATFFAQVATFAATAGAVAVLFLSGVENPTAVATTIPAANIAPTDGQYLISIISSPPPTGDPAPGTVSQFPIRINPPGSIFNANTASFSSRGPLRSFAHVKPDVTAPGVNVLMGASPTGVPIILGDPDYFNSASGTSFSGPHISGTAALVRDANTASGGRPDFKPSQVRAALMNSATNLRLRDNITPIPDSDKRNFIHATGAGLAEMVRATSVKAVMGTNELNGTDGPDNPRNPNFLPSYSFGKKAWIGTNLPASDPRQQASITVTLADVSTLGGSYNLTVIDGGGNSGQVTKPITTGGFSLSLSQTFVGVPADGRNTFKVNVAVDGTGLQLAGTDVNGAQATEFIWYVVATRSGGSESLRMPFYLRVVKGCPQNPNPDQDDAEGDGEVDRGDGHSAHFTATGQASCPPSGQVSFDDKKDSDTDVVIGLKGSVSSFSVSGNTATFSGPCTLLDGSVCQYTLIIQDNADPGNGADSFTIRWTTAVGASSEISGLLTKGNIVVHGH